MDKNEQKQDALTELGTDLTSTKNGSIYTLTIIGQVEGHQVLPENAKTTKYEHILPLLANIEESEEIDGLLLLLNTVGGDIEAGLAIAEMVSGMKTAQILFVVFIEMLPAGDLCLFHQPDGIGFLRHLYHRGYYTTFPPPLQRVFLRKWGIL